MADVAPIVLVAFVIAQCDKRDRSIVRNGFD